MVLIFQHANFSAPGKRILTMSQPEMLSRRERQIMDIVFRRGDAGVLEVLEELDSPPSYSAVRATMRILEHKGHLRHEVDGQRYLFKPTEAVENAARSALRRLVKTFFDDSPEQAIVALLDDSQEGLSDEELARIERLIATTREGEQE